MEPLPVAAGLDVGEVEAGLVRVRGAELARDERVLARLVPEVVVHRRPRPAVLPAALDLERLRVDDREAAGGVAVGVAEHRDDDVLARHAVRRVRARVAGRAQDLVGLDHLLDPRPQRVVGDVDDVDPRGAEAGDDQVRAVRAVAGRRAAVPAEVVELVADVGHRRLVHDLPVGLRPGPRVDDGEEVGRVDARAGAHRDDVEVLLGRRLLRVRGGAVERRGLVPVRRRVIRARHSVSFRSVRVSAQGDAGRGCARLLGGNRPVNACAAPC